jgi:hypothetical protein
MDLCLNCTEVLRFPRGRKGFQPITVALPLVRKLVRVAGRSFFFFLSFRRGSFITARKPGNLAVLRIAAPFKNGLFFSLGLAGPVVTTRVRVFSQ